MPNIPGQETAVEEQEEESGNVLFRLARYLWGVGGKWLRIAIFVAAGALLLILGTALTGVPAIIALTALVPLVAILLVPARINPVWLLAIAVWPDRILVNEKRRVLPQGIPLGGNELRRGVRWIFAFVAVEVGMAFYYASVEYLAPSVDRTLVLVTFALFVFIALVMASPSGKIKTRAIGVLSVVFVVLTVIFLFGGKSEFGDKLEAIGNDEAKAAPAEVKGTDANVCPGEPDSYNFGLGITQVTVRLQQGCWTGWVTTPPESSYRVDLGPLGSTAGIEFWDGTALIFQQGEPQYVGTKRGIFRLRTNSEAREATVTIS